MSDLDPVRVEVVVPLLDTWLRESVEPAQDIASAVLAADDAHAREVGLVCTGDGLTVDVLFRAAARLCHLQCGGPTTYHAPDCLLAALLPHSVPDSKQVGSVGEHYAIYVCGGDESPGKRDECPDPLHDYPLPTGYVDASIVAERRLSRRWSNRKCKVCGLYGWIPSARDLDTPRVLPEGGEQRG